MVVSLDTKSADGRAVKGPRVLCSGDGAIDESVDGSSVLLEPNCSEVGTIDDVIVDGPRSNIVGN